MHYKIFFAVTLLFMLLAGSGLAYNLDYKEMIVKYGPVPDAILDPPVSEGIASEKGSLLSSLFGSQPRARKNARMKACYANQRISLGAIEMYNMDHATMYKTLVFSDVSDASGMLVAGKYLRSPLSLPEPSCHLRSYGDLSDIGIVYCDYHGCLPDDQEGLRNASGYTPKARAATEKNNPMLAVFIILGVLSVGVMIVLHNVLPKAPRS